MSVRVYDGGKELRAEFFVEEVRGRLEVVWKAGGGKDTNPDYPLGLRTILTRMARASATVLDVFADSAPVQQFEPSMRRLQLTGFAYPIRLTAATDAKELCQSIQSALSAKKVDGNGFSPTSRFRIAVEVPAMATAPELQAYLSGERSESGAATALPVGVDPSRYRDAITRLREQLRRAPAIEDFRAIVAARDAVLATFQPVFAKDAVERISVEQFRAFLVFRNNRHWKGLQRLGPVLTSDMPALQRALAQLVAEDKPLAERIDYANDAVNRLAQAVLTPVLLVSSGGRRYGVWNRVSEAGLSSLGIMPSFDRDASLGTRYAQINEVLVALARDLNVDLWTLDALWWVLLERVAGKFPDYPATGRVWIEYANEAPHGGAGWELGTCLWSPSRNRAGNDRYAAMREAQPGDLVLHFAVPEDGGDRLILGWSTVAAPYEESREKPPQPDAYEDATAYYRVPLKDFERAPVHVTVKKLQDSAEATIRAEMEREQSYPFAPYGSSLRPPMGVYLTRCTRALFDEIRALFEEDSEPDLRDVCTAFADALRAANITFGDDHLALVRRFVCSLATKRFVILTGLSGSGKTQLALKFGQWLGGDRYELVPVRPDWTGPEPLLGYEDALLPAAGDRRAWNVPRALEFMLRAARDPENPYLLILDEMNLAHVERYFADVLSGMESREAILPDLHYANGYWRIGDQRRLPFPDNLLVVGTVNVDETTYMFSPKVLDRANTIEFRVATSALASDPAQVRRPEACRAGTAAQISAFLEIARTDHDASSALVRSASDEFRQLHAELSKTGDEFGHRTYFEGARLAAMLEAAGEDNADRVVDVFVLQKVLPRLHGARRRLEPILQELARKCLHSSATSEDVFSAADQHVRLPMSYRKVQRLHRALRANQFASFAD